jgi:hypothetical protein
MTISAENFAYAGAELNLFANALNWRAYWQRQAAPFIGRRVVEVGAGIGTIARDLCDAGIERWLALEPDWTMASRLESDHKGGRLPAVCEIRCGTTGALAPDETFDTALYIDVLEHIERDRAEVTVACDHLATGGHLIVVAPAHQALYSPFDAAIGHFRRYSLRRLLDLPTEAMVVRRARYLDSVGVLASAANCLVLRQPYPNNRQIQVWDKWMIPISRWVDPLLAYSLGKSVLAIWQKRPA